MKNIHLLPTDKPSRLHLGNSGLVLCEFVLSKYTINGQHIYITSDEEIKEGYAYYPELNEVLLFDNKHGEVYEKGRQLKIILTTDQDLIADGVQAIDDEFLEWFVKNPSCEFVEVNDSKVVKEHIFDGSNDGEIIWEKKIIIPQEELKQDKWEQLRGAGLDQPLTSWNDPKKHVELINNNIEEFDKSLIEYKNKKNKFKQDLNDAMHEAHQTGRAMKQETLEEAAERLFSEEKYPTSFETLRKAFISNAKWHAERMYSEEEVIKLLIYCKDRFSGSGLEDYHHDDEVKEWFKQFKKK